MDCGCDSTEGADPLTLDAGMLEIPDVIRELVGSSPDGFALTTRGCYAYVNASYGHLLGIDPGQLVGQLVENRMPPEDRASLRSWLEDRDRGGVELRFVHADGSRRVLELTPLRGLRVGGAESEGFVAFDVTRKRRVQADLLVADRMMSIGALAAGVAHDINNPLSYVLGNLDFLRSELPTLLHGYPELLAADIREAVLEAQEGAERVRSIVSDLRAFARSDSGVVRELDVARIVEAALNMAFVEIRHRARLEKEVRPLPPVRANEARLGQVILNLLLNSVHAMRAGQQDRNLIRVSTRTVGDRACIQVSDNGPGIPPEIVGRVFDPFFTTKPTGIGTGLGLAMVHGVVTELGGTIEVDSQLGVGTTFTVRLPTARSQEKTPTDPRGMNDNLDKTCARVLVVDDDPLITATLRRVLIRDGHTVETEDGGPSALVRLKADSDFDVVFCDLLMPKVSGIDVHAWVMRNRPELAARMVFMSGGVFTPPIHAFLNSVDNPSLDKPFEPESVNRIVRERVRSGRGGPARAGD